MNIPGIIEQKQKGFSIEILPPLKGRSIEKLFKSIDPLLEYGPSYINITTHRSEIIYKKIEEGFFKPVSERSRPGTVAVAAAIQSRLGIPAVPHLICSGYSRTETEYALIDLSFIGITNVLILRGDKAKHESKFNPDPNGHSLAIQLQEQVNQFNKGFFADGTEMDVASEIPFSYGVAGYPEKHEESPNIDIDIQRLKAKVDAGADYIVTQMFFDNNKFFEFEKNVRAAGITVPIIPGIKPITTINQISLLPKTFKVDIPTELFNRLVKCSNDAEVKQVGIEWCVQQSKELYDSGIKSIHYYTHNATNSVLQTIKQIF